LGEIQYASFPHNADEIGEIFENRCNENLVVLNDATKILSIFYEYFSWFGEN